MAINYTYCATMPISQYTSQFGENNFVSSDIFLSDGTYTNDDFRDGWTI